MSAKNKQSKKKPAKALPKIAFGVDIGGSGIKGALVDLETGQFATERVRIPTPQPAKPQAVADVVAELVDQVGVPAGTPIGITFPAAIKNGRIPFIANLHKSWVKVDIPELFEETLGRQVLAVNDADAAGYAEAIYGAAHGINGLVIVTTLGTGIGSAFVYDGVLVPNTELGHLEINGHDAEKRASDAARERDGLTYQQWAKRLQTYYHTLDMLFSPDLIIVGGGVSKYSEEFLPLISLRCPIVPAELLNSAGIVGAARLAAIEAAE